MGDFGAGPPEDWHFTAGLVLFLAWPIVLAASGLLCGMAGAAAWAAWDINLDALARKAYRFEA